MPSSPTQRVTDQIGNGGGIGNTGPVKRIAPGFDRMEEQTQHIPRRLDQIEPDNAYLPAAATTNAILPLRQWPEELLERKLVDCPLAFICPITQEIMVDPVVCASGITYDRRAILRHLAGDKVATDPITRMEVQALDLRHNIALRDMIEAYMGEPHGWGLRDLEADEIEVGPWGRHTLGNTHARENDRRF